MSCLQCMLQAQLHIVPFHTCTTGILTVFLHTHIQLVIPLLHMPSPHIAALAGYPFPTHMHSSYSTHTGLPSPHTQLQGSLCMQLQLVILSPHMQSLPSQSCLCEEGITSYPHAVSSWLSLPHISSSSWVSTCNLQLVIPSPQTGLPHTHPYSCNSSFST